MYNNRRLNKLQDTLEKLHGVTINFENVSDDDLTEAYNISHAEKDKIIKESSFNNYHSDPEYSKHLLIMEAIKVYLREIAPKRIKRPVAIKESREMKMNRKEAMKQDTSFYAEEEDDTWCVFGDNTGFCYECGPVGGEEAAKRIAKEMTDAKKQKESASPKETTMKVKTSKSPSLLEQKKALLQKMIALAEQKKELAEKKMPAGFAAMMAAKKKKGKKTECDDGMPEKVKENRRNSLSMLLESDLEQAEVLLAAKDLSSKLQKIIEQIAQMQVQELMPLVDRMREVFSSEQASAFDTAVKEKLQSSLNSVKEAKDGMENEILRLDGKLDDGNDMSNHEEDADAVAAGGGDMGDDMSDDLGLGDESVDGGGEGDTAEGGDDSLNLDDDVFAGDDSMSGPLDEPVGRAKKDESVKKTGKVVIEAVTAQDKKEFNAYLKNCTDRQLQGIYEKEKAAGRKAYVSLVVAAAASRGVSLNESIAVKKKLTESDIDLLSEKALTFIKAMGANGLDINSVQPIGEWRWSEHNGSAKGYVHSDQYVNNALIIISAFENGTFTRQMFVGNSGSGEDSEFNRPENFTHYNYSGMEDVPEAVKDVKDDLEELDRRYESWNNMDESSKYPAEVLTVFEDFEYYISNRKLSILEAKKSVLSRYKKLHESTKDSVLVSVSKIEECLEQYIKKNSNRLLKTVALNGLSVPTELNEAITGAGITETIFRKTLLEYFEDSKKKFTSGEKYKEFVSKVAENASKNPKVMAAWIAKLYEEKNRKETYTGFIQRVTDAHKLNEGKSLNLTENEKDVLSISTLHSAILESGFAKWYENGGMSGYNKKLALIKKVKGSLFVESLLKKATSVIGEHVDEHGVLDEFALDKLKQLDVDYTKISQKFEESLADHLNQTINESNDSITYSTISDSKIEVKLGKKIIGYINRVPKGWQNSIDGWQYCPKGSKTQGDVLKSVGAVKRTLEESKTYEGDADYRKINDGSHSSSTYHKKDGTPVRAKLKKDAAKQVKDETCNECSMPINECTCEELSEGFDRTMSSSGSMDWNFDLRFAGRVEKNVPATITWSYNSHNGSGIEDIHVVRDDTGEDITDFVGLDNVHDIIEEHGMDGDMTYGMVSQGGDNFPHAFESKSGGKKLDEKWKDAAPIKHTGEWEGKTIKQLQAIKKKLMAKEEKSEDDHHKIKQIDFAIRAKRDFKGGTK